MTLLKLEYENVVEEDVMVPMCDGFWLATDTYRPSSAYGRYRHIGDVAR